MFNARAAVPIQIRFGGDIDSKFGFAPYVEPELAFHLSDEFNLGINMRAQYIVSDGFLRIPRVLPQNAVVLAGGISCNFLF